MEREIIGELNTIIRYPVKSFYGEAISKSRIESYGLYGDRSHVFIDETKAKKYLMATHFPELMGYKAKFEGEERADQYPNVKITSPNGKVYDWEDHEFVREIQTIAGNHIYPKKYAPSYVPIGAIEEEPILIVTDSSIKKMESIWGNKIDYRRFRPNLVISLKEDISFSEDNWFGKRMIIGNIELEIKRHCERCMIINIDPSNLKKDSSLLKTVVRERNNYFGVYATVIKTGEISTGEKVYLENRSDSNE